MEEFFSNLSDATNWPPRWVCGKWSEFHGWLYIGSDLAIWAAYFTIPVTMLLFITKRKEDIPFVKIFWLFIFFILACGTTHLVDAIMFWYPAYRVSALILFITAAVSWTAVYGLFKVLPDAISLRSPAQLQRVIEARTAELSATNENLLNINKELDTFIYIASHDLKSPINNLEGLLDIAKNEKKSDTLTREVYDKMDFCIKRMKKTISDLSEVIKVEKKQLDDIQDNDVLELINEVLSENEELFKKSGSEIILDLQVPLIRFSRTILKSTLYNLLTNAAKYRSPIRKSTIKISLLREEGDVILRVMDNGIGIDLDLYGHKIFGLFKRFHDHVEGSGLGLYMIKRMIEDKGGKIEVTSKPEQGSVFTVHF